MAGTIHFTPRPEKIVESLLYIANKGNYTRYQIVKFFYLADREHLRRYGRPITYDHYVAMKNGPVASIAYDLLKGQNAYGIDVTSLPFDLIEMGAHFGISSPKRKTDLEVLSRSDTNIFDSVIEEFGECSFEELWEHTHQHQAYKEAWENRSTLAEPMAFDEFFEDLKDKQIIIDDLSFAARGM